MATRFVGVVYSGYYEFRSFEPICAVNCHVAASIHNKEGNQRMQYSPSCQKDSAEKSETGHLKFRSAARTVAVLACAVGLTACSSKPETEDIQQDLAEA